MENIAISTIVGTSSHIICLNCSNSVVFFVYFYHMLELIQHCHNVVFFVYLYYMFELFQQCGIFCLFLSYV